MKTIVFLCSIFLFIIHGFGFQSWEAMSFPIMGWYGPTPGIVSDSVFQAMVDAGFTANFSLDASRSQNLSMLDIAAKVGLKLMIMDNRINARQPVDAAALKRLDSVVMDYKDSPALLGYHVIDEPGTNLFGNIAAIKNHLNEKDPNHLVYANLSPTHAVASQLGSISYQAHIDDFMSMVQPNILSFDHYPIESTGLRLDYYENLDIIRTAAMTNKVPFWAFTLTTPHFNYPMPSEGHIRFQLYSDLAYGARGLQYFTYCLPNFEPFLGMTAPINAAGAKTPIWYMAQNVNREILKMAPVLKSLTSIEVYHSAPLPKATRGFPAKFPIVSIDIPMVVGYFKNPQNTHYVMLVNRDYTSGKTATITVSDTVDGVVEVSKVDGSELPQMVKDGKDVIHLAFTAGEGRLFRLVDPSSIGIISTKRSNSELTVTAEADPWCSSATIRFSLPRDSRGTYRIFNSQGQSMYRTHLFAGPAGLQGILVWNGTDLEGRKPRAGLFFGSLEIAKGEKAVHKFLIAK